MVAKPSALPIPSPSPPSWPAQRWQIPTPQPLLVGQIADATGLDLLLAQVLVNRGITTLAQAEAFLNPESLVLPSPLSEFADLEISVDLLEQAIAHHWPIAICGDYDADGMTSTALLLRALKALGAEVDYAIPSRMQEGYGLNERIVDDFYAQGVRLILTVDNGIAAHEPIALARDLGLAVIVTDHHDLPPELPPANAILNPKLLPSTSLYAGLAGVGVAYILAVSLAQRLGKTGTLVTTLLELCTLGTIADLAALTGVNRRWVKRGLQLLPRSQLAGVQALIQVSGGVTATQTGQGFKPETIGFRLGPRINAVGRIGDPQTVIELLRTDEPQVALERAMQCEQTNRERQQLCTQIEQEAIAWIEANPIDLLQERVLVVVQPHWHHGVIGIVASRLVERYGAPVFIGSSEDGGQIRGSARGIPEFDIFAALQFSGDLLLKFGGHRAAGGFTLEAKNLQSWHSRLRQFACQTLLPEQLRPLINVDVQASFRQLTWELYHQIDRLQPCGIGNPEPVFWSAGVEILEQKLIGQGGAHLKLIVAQPDDHNPHQRIQFKAMAWRWGQYLPLPKQVDIAYRLQENNWQGETSLELALLGVRPAATQSPRVKAPKALARSDSRYQIDLQLLCPEPPLVQFDPPPQWLAVEHLPSLLPELEGPLLVYGQQRPYLSVTTTAAEIDYDRPSRPCQTFLLWTLPPSWTHLRWLLSRGKPNLIYVRNVLPKLPTGNELRTHLRLHLSNFANQPLNLLELGQQFWVAPSTLVAALREMHFTCDGFPQTCSLEQELHRLERWYSYPPQELGKLV